MNFQDDIMESVQAYISKKTRDSIPDEDFADPEHKKYPVRTQEEFEAALKLAGRSKDKSPSAVREAILRIGKRKGFKMPESEK